MRSPKLFGKGLAVAATLLVVMLGRGSTASARNHKVEAGETLIQIARAYGCSVEELQRANHVDTTLIRAGRVIKVPTCKRRTTTAAMARPSVAVKGGVGQSVGEPWGGSLRSPSRLMSGRGYTLRRPERTFATANVVSSLRTALMSFHQKFPKAHSIAVGDLSARSGGALSQHRSHQSGRDADIGLIFKRRPAGYPTSFVVATEATLDAGATWGLLSQFARTADSPGGVSVVFLDFEVQGLLYKWALAHGAKRAYLDRIFQYPHGRDAAVGLVRHWPAHDDHMHVRWHCAATDKSCS